MKFKLHYISSSLVILFVTGVLLSSFHLHFDQSHSIETEPPHYIQDHNFCSLCASQFQYSGDTDLQPEADFRTEELVPTYLSFSVSYSLNLIQNYRAPPLFS